MSRTNIIINSTLLLMILVFTGLYFHYQSNETKETNLLISENQNILVRNHSPTLGPDNAKVTLVEFLDPECETCREFHPFVKKLLSDYSGRIKLVVRYAPFHGNSEYMVKVLEAARFQEKYWETLEVLFRYQPQWGSHHNPQPELIWNYLPQTGVDIEKIKQTMNHPNIIKALQQDWADLKTLGIRKTPTFFINGKPLIEFGKDSLRRAIELELNR